MNELSAISIWLVALGFFILGVGKTKDDYYTLTGQIFVFLCCTAVSIALAVIGYAVWNAD